MEAKKKAQKLMFSKRALSHYSIAILLYIGVL
jgi:hypothetical protein